MRSGRAWGSQGRRAGRWAGRWAGHTRRPSSSARVAARHACQAPEHTGGTYLTHCQSAGRLQEARWSLVGLCLTTGRPTGLSPDLECWGCWPSTGSSHRGGRSCFGCFETAAGLQPPPCALAGLLRHISIRQLCPGALLGLWRRPGPRSPPPCARSAAPLVCSSLPACSSNPPSSSKGSERHPKHAAAHRLLLRHSKQAPPPLPPPPADDGAHRAAPAHAPARPQGRGTHTRAALLDGAGSAGDRSR